MLDSGPPKVNTTSTALLDTDQVLVLADQSFLSTTPLSITLVEGACSDSASRTHLCLVPLFVQNFHSWRRSPASMTILTMAHMDALGSSTLLPEAFPGWPTTLLATFLEAYLILLIPLHYSFSSDVLILIIKDMIYLGWLRGESD